LSITKKAPFVLKGAFLLLFAIALRFFSAKIDGIHRKIRPLSSIPTPKKHFFCIFGLNQIPTSQ